MPIGHKLVVCGTVQLDGPACHLIQYVAPAHRVSDTRQTAVERRLGLDFQPQTI